MNNDTLSKLKFLSNNEFSEANQDNDDYEIKDAKDLEASEVRALRKYSKKLKNANDDMQEFINESLRTLGMENLDDIDSLIDDFAEYDEDADLRNSLLASGRKYARDYMASGEVSEVTKAFAPQEARLNDLFAAVSREASKTEEDIEEIRKLRSRNYTKLADLLEVKGTLYNTQLSIIKEMNATKKAQFDIKNKMKEITGGDTGSTASSSVIQSIFGIGHDSLLNGVGGREGSSGAYIDDSTDDSFEDSEEYRQIVGEETDTDGDRFLKYEGQGVRYILAQDDSGHREVFAEDQDGNRIDDYPIPENIEELTFDINEKTGVAIDQLQRRYEFRNV